MLSVKLPAVAHDGRTQDGSRTVPFPPTWDGNPSTPSRWSSRFLNLERFRHQSVGNSDHEKKKWMLSVCLSVSPSLHLSVNILQVNFKIWSYISCHTEFLSRTRYLLPSLFNSLTQFWPLGLLAVNQSNPQLLSLHDSLLPNTKSSAENNSDASPSFNGSLWFSQPHSWISCLMNSKDYYFALHMISQIICSSDHPER